LAGCTATERSSLADRDQSSSLDLQEIRKGIEDVLRKAQVMKRSELEDLIALLTVARDEVEQLMKRY
jgi:hypothetical protein